MPLPRADDDTQNGERMDADVLIIGAGLAGLVAGAELVAAGKRVLIV